MFKETINILKDSNLINQNDVIIICRDNNNNYTSWSQSSLIVALVETLELDIFVLAANEEGVRIFDVDRTTGEYLGKYRYFRREEIIKAKVSGFLGSFAVWLKTTSGVYRYITRKKLKDHFQKEHLLKLRELFKFLF